MEKVQEYIELFKFSDFLMRICNKYELLNSFTLAALKKETYQKKLKGKIINSVKQGQFWDDLHIKNEEDAREWLDDAKNEELLVLMPFGPTLRNCCNFFAQKMNEDQFFFNNDYDEALEKQIEDNPVVLSGK